MYINYINFGYRIFPQRKRIEKVSVGATGASVSVAYANIYVHSELMQTYKGPIKPLLEYRFVDDVFGIFPGNSKQLSTYIEFLQKNKGNLEFTLEFNETKMNFLDVTLKKDRMYFWKQAYIINQQLNMNF
jgi:hypothetical protein